jgi:N-acetylglutamate synthase-like GNAT family acetyltransferase
VSENRIVIRKIRRYEIPDVKKLFLLNSPLYFDPLQQENLSDFLDKHFQNYLIIELDNEIIGGGGYWVSYTKTAFINWLMVPPAFKNQGFGSLILQQIIREIRKNKSIRTIEALTSQYSYNFFLKHGFMQIDMRKDFWGDGLDLHKMQITYKKEWVKFG